MPLLEKLIPLSDAIRLANDATTQLGGYSTRFERRINDAQADVRNLTLQKAELANLIAKAVLAPLNDDYSTLLTAFPEIQEAFERRKSRHDQEVAELAALHDSAQWRSLDATQAELAGSLGTTQAEVNELIAEIQEIENDGDYRWLHEHPERTTWLAKKLDELVDHFDGDGLTRPDRMQQISAKYNCATFEELAAKLSQLNISYEQRSSALQQLKQQEAELESLRDKEARLAASTTGTGWNGEEASAIEEDLTNQLGNDARLLKSKALLSGADLLLVGEAIGLTAKIQKLESNISMLQEQKDSLDITIAKIGKQSAEWSRANRYATRRKPLYLNAYPQYLVDVPRSYASAYDPFFVSYDNSLISLIEWNDWNAAVEFTNASYPTDVAFETLPSFQEVLVQAPDVNVDVVVPDFNIDTHYGESFDSFHERADTVGGGSSFSYEDGSSASPASHASYDDYSSPVQSNYSGGSSFGWNGGGSETSSSPSDGGGWSGGNDGGSSFDSGSSGGGFGD